MQALGFRFLDGAGKQLINLPEALIDLASVDLSSAIGGLQGAEIIVLCDVDNQLLGEHGSAKVFGPQKGATPAAVEILDAALARLAAVAFQQTGREMAGIQYGGTAGGAAAGLYAFLNANLVNGIDYFLELTGFEQALKKSHLVITGEGSIDEQTLQGKAPFGLAKLARKNNIPVVGLAGKLPLAKNEHLQQYFDVLLPIGNEPTRLPTALANTAENLRRTAEQLGNVLAMKR